MIEKIDLTDPKNKAFADMFLPFAKRAIQTLEKELKTEQTLSIDDEIHTAEEKNGNENERTKTK